MKKEIPLLIRIFLSVKNFGKKFYLCKTWHLEQAFVAIILIAVALITKKGHVEWMGVIAVYLTFGHVLIAERLREAEASRVERQEKILVECYKKIDWYYYGKETFWLIYFILLDAYSALAGIAIFLLYRPWRKYYRKYVPAKY